MDIGFDHNTWRGQPAQRDSGHPDWHALRARLGAAAAMRASIAGVASASDGGSFDATGARLIANYAQCLATVNLVASADGNRECEKDAETAGTFQPGGRG